MPQDIISGNSNTNATVSVGTPIISTGDFLGDEDWFRVNLTAGIGYTIELLPVDPSSALTYTFYVHGPNGFQTQGTSETGSHPVIDGLLPDVNATYYIQVFALGEYSLSVNQMVDTIGEGVNTNGAIEVGEEVRSTLDSLYDEDWYAIELTGGQIYEFTIDRTIFYPTISGLVDPNLVIYDSNGNVYATLDDGQGYQSYFFAEIATTGTYYVAASLWDFGAENVGTYALAVQIEAASGTHTQMSLTEDVPQEGSLLWSNDTDWYGVELQAGVTYDFFFSERIYGADTSSQYIDFNVLLTLHDAAGASVANGSATIVPRNSISDVPTLQFTPTTSGTFFIEVHGVDMFDLGYYTIAYEARPTAVNDIAGSASTTTTLALGATLNSVIDTRADHDWIAVNLVQGHSYAIALNGNQPGTNVAPQFAVRRPDGSVLSTMNGFIADATGTFYIDVTTRPQASTPLVARAAGEGGAYTLSITEDDGPGITTTVSTISPGQTIIANLHAATLDPSNIGIYTPDVDCFRINFVAGQTYIIAVDEIGFYDDRLSTELYLRNIAGDLLQHPIGNQNYIVFTPSTSGLYFLQVYNGLAITSSDYELRVDTLNTGSDTYATGVTSTGLITTASPITSTVDYVSDSDWFAINVVSGQYYTLTLTGAGPTALSSFALIAAYNNTAWAGYDWSEDGTSATVTFLADITGTMWAGVAANSGFNAPSNATVLSLDTGGYTLTLTSSATSGDTVADNSSTTATANVGAPFSSAIEYVGDVDWIRIPVVAGEYYNFNFESDLNDDNYWGLFIGTTEITGAPYLATTTGDIFVRVVLWGNYNSDYTLSVQSGAGAAGIALIGDAATPLADGVFRLYFSTEAIGWSAENINIVLTAWATFAEYANIAFEVTTDINAADFVYRMIEGTGNDGWRSSEPDNTLTFFANGDTFGEPDYAGYRGAVPGGQGFANLLSITAWQLGLRNNLAATTTDSMRDFWLSQGVYTVLGFADGWRVGQIQRADVPDLVSHSYWYDSIIEYRGVQGGPMALDIAALQAMYGATNANAGDTTFDLATIVNEQFRTIWDVGGTDTLMIAASNTTGAVLDLRAATLNYEYGGGGYVSYIRGVSGGFTIAGGVLIEHATGGGGADILIGNSANNTLTGNNGDDTLTGNGGANILNGGAGSDTASYAETTAGVNISLLVSGAQNTGGGATDTFISIENLTGSGHADTLIGDGAVNVLSGNQGNDRLTGNGGNDILNGGAGSDAAVYVMASTSATWTRTPGGGWTVTSADGTDTLTGIETLSFSDRDVFLDRASQSFAGDGTSDLLLRHSNGTLSVWFVQGASISGAGLGSITAEWSPFSGDFNGDGRDDILWRNTANGTMSVWFMNGASTIGVPFNTVATNWAIEGIGDFNGDTRDDILWRNTTTGDMSLWFMDTTTVTGGAFGNVGSGWIVEALGDFNGDGRDDILWRESSSGAMSMWFMNGQAVTGGAFGTVGNTWIVEGAGDFNGDGRDDIFWRNGATAQRAMSAYGS